MQRGLKQRLYVQAIGQAGAAGAALGYGAQKGSLALGVRAQEAGGDALRERAAGPARCGMLFAFLAAIAMMLGLMRWPSLHWELALAWSAAGPEQRAVFAALFDGLNRYLGNYLGEFLGELAFSLFFTLSAVGLWRHPRAPRWLAGWGFATGVLGLIGLWRNVSAGSAGSASGAIAAVAEVNNYLLPAWMIGMGVWLMRASRAR